MVTSLFNDILLLRNSDIAKIAEYLHAHAIKVFDPIIESTAYNEKEKAQIILYIFCAYSEESPLIIIRQDSKEEKEQICEYLNIPDYMRGKVTTFSDNIIKTVTTTYLWQFAGEVFRNLMFMKIQYEDFDRDITDRKYSILQENDPIPHYDIKEHGKAIAERERLSKAIMKVEQEIKTQIKRYEAIEDMRFWKDKAKGKYKTAVRGVNMENSIHIK